MRGRSVAIVAGFGLVTTVLLVAFRDDLRRFRRWNDWGAPDSICFATGPRGSADHVLGRRLETLLEDRFPALEVAVLETYGGSLTNTKLLEAGQADFGFVQNRPPDYPYPSLRTVARLYEETLQIVGRRDHGVFGMADLAGRTVGLGPCASTVRELAEGVLDHFGYPVVGRPDCSTGSRVAEAVPAWGEVDATAYLGVLPTPAVRERLEKDGAVLLPLGEPDRAGSALEGVSIALNGLRPSRVPARTYGGAPAESVGTLGVDVLLVTRDGLPERMVEEVTRIVFESRYVLAADNPALERMEELRPDVSLRFPVHPGAFSFYSRNRPHPLVQWAEPMSFALALLLSLGSGLLAFRQWFHRLKKNRIDRFYVELEGLSDEIATADSVDEIVAIEERLHGLRKRAFEDLVAERLLADESFSIFQTSLSHRMMEISHRLASRQVGENAS